VWQFQSVDTEVRDQPQDCQGARAVREVPKALRVDNDHLGAREGEGQVSNVPGDEGGAAACVLYDANVEEELTTIGAELKWIMDHAT
jgi:hypothetical protein